MRCDLCGGAPDRTESLRAPYRIDGVADLCPGCADAANVEWRRLRAIADRWLAMRLRGWLRARTRPAVRRWFGIGPRRAA